MSGATAELVVPTTLLPVYEARLVPHRRQERRREEGRESRKGQVQGRGCLMWNNTRCMCGYRLFLESRMCVFKLITAPCEKL